MRRAPTWPGSASAFSCRRLPARNMHLGLRHDEFWTRRLYYDQHPGRLARHGGTNNRLGVRPEIEAFDAGHLWLAKSWLKKANQSPRSGAIMYGNPVGAPDDLNTFMAMSTTFRRIGYFRLFPSAQRLGISGRRNFSRRQCAGGFGRQHLSDKRRPRRQRPIVEKAVAVVENMGAKVIDAPAVREKLKLNKRPPPTGLR